MKIPERLNDFRVYDSESQDMMGIADVTTPTITAMTETISGAGFAGEIDSVVLGHVGSMTTVINWNAVTDKVASLAAPGKHSLDIRGAMQHYDTGAFLRLIQQHVPSLFQNAVAGHQHGYRQQHCYEPFSKTARMPFAPFFFFHNLSSCSCLKFSALSAGSSVSC